MGLGLKLPYYGYVKVWALELKLPYSSYIGLGFRVTISCIPWVRTILWVYGF